MLKERQEAFPRAQISVRRRDAFALLTNSRTREDGGRDVVERFLAGDMTQAGTSTLFRGKSSLHGVTEVKGARVTTNGVSPCGDG